MKLRHKIVIYNAISKGLIILAFGALLPIVVEKIVYNHIDRRLNARTEKVEKIIERGGLHEISLEQDCSFESYDILKEEFITIGPLENDPDYPMEPTTEIRDWEIDGDQLNHRVLITPFVYDNQLYELNIGEGLSSIEALNGTIYKFTLFTMLGIILLSIFIDTGFIHYLMRPFNRIIVHKLKATKDPTSFKYDRIDSNTEEFIYLDDSINDLMRRTNEAFLIEKEFIANVSHELLTPISVLQNRMENLVADGTMDENSTEKIIESQRTLGRLSQIIRSLLMISKIENAQYIKTDTCDIKEIIDDVCEELHELIEDKNIQLNKSISSFKVQEGNRSLLFNMFFNVINNAIKYNKPSGSITITSSDQADKYSVTVADTGVGIDDEHLPNIFDRFKRFDKKNKAGYGLGLPIVKTIADFHDIEIDVQSEVNNGSTFSFAFTT
ncbi:MAG: sensor histidine kinase [Bacteroidia bacterium]|nr:sensor histidine kinase [Bacteroidia bacterium]